MDDRTTDDATAVVDHVTRRRSPKGERSRGIIVDAALNIFSSTGYNNSSISDIAKIAGISTPGVLHHFPNKLSLLMAVLERQDVETREQIAAISEANTLDSMMKYLLALITYSAQSYAMTLVFNQLNTESLAEDHPAWLWYQQRYDMLHASADREFRELIDKGEVRADIDVKMVRNEIFAVMDGLQIQWLRRPGNVDLVAGFKMYLSRLTEYLRP
ncbi:TetR/AcrR family transcriptional regulator [Rahnella sp. ChDrAdgB13]|uniref:TetR/AcrR family transcriptional regulator n=1 Tax=Rahnella sp. ChDrAdgB13 TaxID=1850581 RepID=UPI001AD892EC|nr:TetR/AcrR family transcriptional regulator [Rahnella sp. ChDrAdgB13]